MGLLFLHELLKKRLKSKICFLSEEFYFPVKARTWTKASQSVSNDNSEMSIRL